MARTRPLTWKNNLAHDPVTDRWHVRKMIRGRITQRSFPTKRAAVSYLEILSLESVGIRADAIIPTLQEAAKLYQERLTLLGRSDHTLVYYHRKMTRITTVLGRNIALDRIDDRTVNTYITARKKKGASTGTIQKELKALRTVSREAGVEPTWRLPAMTHHSRRRMVRTPDEVAALWLHLAARTRPAVALCLFAGIRAEEAYRADASWCRWNEKELWVPVVKTSDWNRTALVDTLAAVLPRTGPLVTPSEGQIRHDLEHASESAGLDPPYRGPGAFRHHCATWAIDAGFDDSHIKLILSHAAGSVTDRYIHSQAVAKKRTVLEAVEKTFLTSLQELTKSLQISENNH